MYAITHSKHHIMFEHTHMPLHILSSTHVPAARSVLCVERRIVIEALGRSVLEALGRSVLEALAAHVLEHHPVVALRPGAGGPIPPLDLQMHLRACSEQ